MSKPLPRPGDLSLLLLADILENADERHIIAGEPLYDQARWAHDCGTPACAIGHWLAQEGRRDCVPTVLDMEARLPDLFELDAWGWAELFGARADCTAKEAAQRIREFVSARSALTV